MSLACSLSLVRGRGTVPVDQGICWRVWSAWICGDHACVWVRQSVDFTRTRTYYAGSHRKYMPTPKPKTYASQFYFAFCVRALPSVCFDVAAEPR